MRICGTEGVSKGADEDPEELPPIEAFGVVACAVLVAGLRNCGSLECVLMPSAMLFVFGGRVPGEWMCCGTVCSPLEPLRALFQLLIMHEIDVSSI